MFNFLHTYYPSPVLINLGWIQIRWYGLMIAIGALLGFLVLLYLGKRYGLKKDQLYDLTFYLVIFGLIGDRLYYVFYAWEYYSKNLLDIFKVWQGGLAIHGAMIAGLIVIYVFGRRKKINPWLLLDLGVVSLALAMAFGRWGNYFNMELFGLPTSLPWGIPIAPENRPLEFMSNTYFQPTFLYESLWNLLTFIILFAWHLLRLAKTKIPEQMRGLGNIALAYFMMYSLGRFGTEFLRLDFSPYVFGMRWAQIVSLVIFLAVLIVIGYRIYLRLFRKIKDPRCIS